MRNFKYYIPQITLVLSFLLIGFSCKDDFDDIDRTYRHTEAPVLESTLPANGSTIEYTSSSVSFTFDKPVTIVDVDLVTINGVAIPGFVSAENSLTIQLPELDESTTYTLVLPKGSIKGVPGILNQEDMTLQFTTSNMPDISGSLVTANASVQAQNVYNFLLENYQQKIVSGTMARVNWNVEEAERVYRWTGKYPALNCFDFVHLYASWIDYSDISVVENWWNNNGLVSIGWHWNVPQEEGSSDYGFYNIGSNSGEGETSFSITNAVQDGTYENEIIKADLDKVADHLLALQAKNIPVLWRPLHEAAGGWFWWGKDAEAYKALWILMFDTFKAKGINNLIWVWTTELGDSNWYPGDAYVDIIGRDIYNTGDAAEIASQYNAIRRGYPTKMVTLSECGNVADIAEQWNSGARWSWFMPWYDYDATDDSDNQHATKEFWQNAFESENVITRDQMPSLK